MMPGRETGKFAFAAVLFDMDGVVLDSMDQHAEIWQELLAEKGFRIPRRFILENEGALGPGVLARFLKDRGLAETDPMAASDLISGLLDRQADLYLERHASRVKPFPQAIAMLATLKRRAVPAALVTSSRRALVEACLGKDLRGLFQAVITAVDVNRHKPHPAPYLAAARALAQPPESCLAVENAPAGIESARAAGTTCYAVCTTLPARSLRQARAVFPDLARLAAHLQLNGAAS